MLITQAVHRRRLRVGLFIGTISAFVGSALKGVGLAALSIPVSPISNYLWDAAMVLGGVGLGSFLPAWFDWWVSKIPLFRRWIMHDTWIEGFWLLESVPLSQSASPQGQGVVSSGVETNDSLRIGVVDYRFRGQNMNLRPEGRHIEFRRSPIGQGTPKGAIEWEGTFWKAIKPAVISNSKLAYIDPSLFYTNVFKYSEGGDGAAVGSFRCGGGAVAPNQFDSLVITKNMSFRQHGKKIDQKIVDALKQQYGDADWEDKLIEHYFKHREAWADASSLKELVPN